MIRILLLIGIIVIIILLLARYVVPFVYKIMVKDAMEIDKGLDNADREYDYDNDKK